MKQLLYEIKDGEGLSSALADVKEEAALCCAETVLLHFFYGNNSHQQGFDCESYVGSILERVEEVLPEARVIGLSSCGEIRQAKLAEPCALLSALLFRSSWVEVLTYQDLPSNEKTAGEWLRVEVESRADLRGVELLFAGRNINSAPIYECLKQCKEGLPFFGGYAAEHDSVTEPSFLVTADGVLRSAMAVVFYGGAELHFDAGRTTGWKPLGNPFRVTEAKGRRLFSINGVPAYDLYNQFLRIPEEESFLHYAMEFPLMVIRGKMKHLRHPRAIYDDSSILLDGSVENGDAICLSYGAPLEIVRKLNARCEKIRSFEPEAILLFSCQGRREFWGDLIGWEMEPFQKVAETGGSCLGGQIMRNSQTGRVLEHRLTLLSIALREGEKKGREIPEIEMDDEILKGKMSLVHRMSTLIESTVEELQKTNETLVGMNEQLARANDELHRIAITDELTGLYNRREIERRIKDSLEKVKTDKSELSLVMLDIDFFKKVNDSYGHDVGDLVLRDVSQILQDYADGALNEAAGRWGGEEFLIMLPGKGIREAVALAEAIRAAVERHSFRTANHLTVSMGVTCANADSSYQAIFLQVDHALYQAKQTGRNRVVSLLGVDSRAY